MATSFGNVGLGQFGQELSGSDPSMGKFLLGAALSSLGVPPQITSFANNQLAVPPKTSMDQSATPVVPGQPMQNPEDERTVFAKSFGGLFSHLPTFGKQ